MIYNDFNFKNVGTNVLDEKKLKKINTKIFHEYPIGIKLPMEFGKRSGESLFGMNFSIEDQIKDNMKILLLSNKNERLRNPDFGTNLYSLFNSTNLSELELKDLAQEEIQSSIIEFMNPLTIDNTNYFINFINFGIEKQKSNRNVVEYILTVQYNISGYSLKDIEILKRIKNVKEKELFSKVNYITLKFSSSN